MGKRILDYPEALAIVDGDYILLDNTLSGAKRYPASSLTSSLITLTQADYNALSESEKNNGKIYRITEESTTLNMSNASTFIENGNVMSITKGNGSVVADRGSGSQIGAVLGIRVDLTNIEAIAYTVHINSFYGNNAYVTDINWALTTAVSPTSIVNSDYMYRIIKTNPREINLHNRSGTFSNVILDTSELTGYYYFNIAISGVIMQMSSIRLCTALNKLMYMSDRYIERS